MCRYGQFAMASYILFVHTLCSWVVEVPKAGSPTYSLLSINSTHSPAVPKSKHNNYHDKFNIPTCHTYYLGLELATKWHIGLYKCIYKAHTKSHTITIIKGSSSSVAGPTLAGSLHKDLLKF